MAVIPAIWIYGRYNTLPRYVRIANAIAGSISFLSMAHIPIHMVRYQTDSSVIATILLLSTMACTLLITANEIYRSVYQHFITSPLRSYVYNIGIAAYLVTYAIVIFITTHMLYTSPGQNELYYGVSLDNIITTFTISDATIIGIIMAAVPIIWIRSCYTDINHTMQAANLFAPVVLSAAYWQIYMADHQFISIFTETDFIIIGIQIITPIIIVHEAYTLLKANVIPQPYKAILYFYGAVSYTVLAVGVFGLLAVAGIPLSLTMAMQ